MGIGARLTEERKRLGFSQGDFARKAGVSVSTQKRYETNNREAGTGYLEEVRKLGVDVTYLLTGRRISGEALGIDFNYLGEFGLATVEYFGISRFDLSEVIAKSEYAVNQQFQGDDDSSSSERVAAFRENFFIHASALLRRQVSGLPIQGETVDQGLLIAAIEQVDRAISQTGKVFPLPKRAHLIALTYKLAKRAGGMDAGIARDVVSIADQ